MTGAARKGRTWETTQHNDNMLVGGGRWTGAKPLTKQSMGGSGAGLKSDFTPQQKRCQRGQEQTPLVPFKVTPHSLPNNATRMHVLNTKTPIMFFFG